jgi:hypothetical protein
MVMTMARPRWTPSPEQQSLLDQAAEEFRRAAHCRNQHETQAWQTVEAAVALGVPKERLPEYIPQSRPTVFRHLRVADNAAPDPEPTPEPQRHRRRKS